MFVYSHAENDTVKLPIPEIFTSGFIDVLNDGQVNASARFIRLYIGEPSKFSIPLSFYGGCQIIAFTTKQTQGEFREIMIISLINTSIR